MIEQNDPIELNRERRIKLSILERIFNSTDKTLFQKLNGEHPAAEDSHTWLFQFVDIIYVGTVANISRFVDRCGAGDMDGSLFVASFSYLVIMFYTRTAFDSYVSISKAGGIIHVAVFCLYAAAVFVMSVNIAGARVKDGEVPGKEFGQCTAEEAHIHAFTSGFIASRVVLLVMYFLYLNVFHESHVTGTFKENLADVTRDTLTAFKRASAKRSSTEIPLDDRLTIGSAISYVSSARAGVVKKHFTGIYCCKIFPLAASAVVMLALVLSKQHPVVIFPTIATMELLADILPSFLSDEEWKKFLLNIHLAKDRLGLFFMLVMGEAMLGFHAVYYGANHSSPESYTVLILSYFIVFTVGLKFFEPFQSDGRVEGKHPLEVKFWSPIYTFTVCLTCFFMLIASNGLVAIYKDINKNSCTNNCEKQQCFDPPTGPPVYNCTESCEKACEMVEESHDEPYVQKQAFGKVVVGVFVVMIGSLILRFLERIHDDPIVDSSTIPRQKTCATWMLSISTLRFVSFLAMSILVPLVKISWLFVLGVTILVMFPTWTEVGLEIYQDVARIVKERVGANDQPYSVEMTTTHSPAHTEFAAGSPGTPSPTHTSANVNAPTMQLAERATDDYALATNVPAQENIAVDAPTTHSLAQTDIAAAFPAAHSFVHDNVQEDAPTTHTPAHDNIALSRHSLEKASIATSSPVAHSFTHNGNIATDMHSLEQAETAIDTTLEQTEIAATSPVQDDIEAGGTLE